MLTQMRAISQNWIGRAILGLVLGVTIIGFVFWGTTTRGGGFGSDDLVKIGDARVSAEEYRDAYQRQLSEIMERQKRQISSEEANRAGLNLNIFGTLLSRAALTAEAGRLGLSVSNNEIARAIAADDRFKDRFGQFDRNLFFGFLANIGMNEASFARDYRRVMLQQDVTDPLTIGLDTPKVMVEAFHRYLGEVRNLTFFVLPPSAAGQIPLPSQDQLKAYYDERTAEFTTPEYRRLTIVSVVPANLVKPDAISDADAKARYEAMKSSLYSVPEKRTLQALSFPDKAAALAAKAKLQSGSTFDQLIAEQKAKPADVNLGTLAKSQINSQVIANAAFSLPVGGTSAPLVGQAGPTLIHVVKIEPGHDEPLIEVQAEIKDQLAIIRANNEAAKIRDKIDEERQNGLSLVQAAKAAGVTPRIINAVSAQGFGKDHKPIEAIPDGPRVLKAAFATDIGADVDEIATTNKGYVWYSVDGVDPSHVEPFAAVKAKVESDWRNDEVQRKLASDGDRLVKALDDGATVTQVAAQNGKLSVLNGRDVGRMGTPNLPSSVASAFFNTPVGKAGSTSDGSAGRIIFKVDAAHVPPLRTGDATFTKLMQNVRQGYEENVLAQFVARVEQVIGVSFNQALLKQTVLGSDAGS